MEEIRHRLDFQSMAEFEHVEGKDKAFPGKHCLAVPLTAHGAYSRA